jgi:tetratricopeptide (TPR) repeat protein
VNSSPYGAFDELPDDLKPILYLLAVHPGPDFDVGAAAAVLGATTSTAAALLDRLVLRHWLATPRRERYRLADQAGTQIADRAWTGAAESGRRTALRRLADHYLRRAEAADREITPFRHRPVLDGSGQTAEPPLDYAAALAWLTAEQEPIGATCIACGEQGLDTQCWQLAYTLRGFYYLTKPWPAWIATHKAALRAAERLADPQAQALICNGLGLARLELGQLDTATEHYLRAIDLATQAGDGHGAATSQANYAWVLYSQQRFDDFLEQIRPAYAFYRRAGARRNAAITLRGIGLAEGSLGRAADAERHLRHALREFQELDLKLDTAMTLNAIGDAFRHAGDANRAVTAYADALRSAEIAGSAFEQARAHRWLAELAMRRGDLGAAARHRGEADRFGAGYTVLERRAAEAAD